MNASGSLSEALDNKSKRGFVTKRSIKTSAETFLWRQQKDWEKFSDRLSLLLIFLILRSLVALALFAFP